MKKKPRSNSASQHIGEISESNMKQHLSIQFHQQGLYVGCFKDPEIGDLQGEIQGKTFLVMIWSQLSHNSPKNKGPECV